MANEVPTYEEFLAAEARARQPKPAPTLTSRVQGLARKFDGDAVMSAMNAFPGGAGVGLGARTLMRAPKALAPAVRAVGEGLERAPADALILARRATRQNMGGYVQGKQRLNELLEGALNPGGGQAINEHAVNLYRTGLGAFQRPAMSRRVASNFASARPSDEVDTVAGIVQALPTMFSPMGARLSERISTLKKRKQEK